MQPAFYDNKARIMALAIAYHEGDETTRISLRNKADFFPLSRKEGDPAHLRSLIIRLQGEIFLVEDTRGGETGVFSLLLPIM